MRKMLKWIMLSAMAMVVLCCSLFAETTSIAESSADGNLDGVFYFEGSHYKIYTGTYTWHEAVEMCEGMGGYLATITSAEEQAFIESINTDSLCLWIGGYRDDDYIWHWVTGEDWDYTNWGEGEPNYMYEPNGEDSAAVWPVKWNDLLWNNLSEQSGFICEWDTISLDLIDLNQYMIKVVDEHGKSLSGATVNFDGDSKKTNESGLAWFGDFVIEDPVISVSMPEYITWTNQDLDWEWQASRFETVILYHEDSSMLRLGSARYSNSRNMALATNLLTAAKKISLGNDGFLTADLDFGNFYISCKSLNTDITEKYQLWQGKKMIAESEDGFFELNTDDFVKGNDCFIRTLGTDGKWVDTRINLTFVKADIMELSSINHSGDEISFIAGENVPFIGGRRLNIDMPLRIPVHIFASDDKIQVGFNVNLAGDKTDKERIAEVKQLCSDLTRLNGLKVGKLTGPQSRKYKALLKNTQTWKFFQEGEINFMGYAEADIGSSTATGAFILQGKIDAANFEFNTWCVVVPVTVQVDMSLEGNIAGQLSYNFSSAGIEGSVRFAPSATLTAFGGVGVSELVGVGAYGSAKLEADLEILPDPTVKKVDLSGELGIKAYLGLFEYEKPFAYNTWHLYTASNSSSAILPEDEGNVLYSLIREDMYDAARYYKHDLSYLEDEMDLMGNPDVQSVSYSTRSPDLQKKFKILIQNTYRNAQPVMVSSGDALYAAFLRADTSSGCVRAVVSKFDGSEWKTAVAASSENLLDSTPELLVDDSGNIWLAYAKTREDYDGNTMLSYARNQSIVVGRIDPDTLAFSCSKVYDGTGYSHMQKLSLVNGKPTLVWVDSTVVDDSSVLWPSQNTIYSACYTGSGWSEPQLVHTAANTVLELAVGELGDELTVAYILDEDNSYETTDDQNLYTITGGAVKLISSGCSGNVTYAKFPGTREAEFIWNSDSGLHTSGGDVLNLKGVGNEYIVVGDRIYFSAATEEGAELNVVKFENEAWSVPIALTEGEGYFENLCVATLNGVDYAFGLYADVTIGDTQITDSKNLVWTKVSSVSDLSIEDAVYPIEGIAAGSTVPVSISVINRGDHGVSSISIYLDGEMLRTESTDLPIGVSKELVVELSCPEQLKTFAFSVYETDAADYTPDDNTAEVSLGYPDLKVSLISEQIGSHCTLYASITNEGVGAASGVLTFSDDAGNILSDKTFSSISPGEILIASYDINWKKAESNRMSIHAVLESDQEDLYDFNNRDSLCLVYAGYMKDDTPDMILPAALKRIESEAFLNGKFASVALNEGMENIGSKAFADCPYLEQIQIPESVRFIAADAFEDTEGFVIYGRDGSAAEEFALEHGIVFISES